MPRSLRERAFPKQEKLRPGGCNPPGLAPRYHGESQNCPRSEVGTPILTRASLCAPCQGVDLQWVQFPPGKGSLQPVAIGAAVEVTILPKPSMERVASGDSASSPTGRSVHRVLTLRRAFNPGDGTGFAMRC